MYSVLLAAHLFAIGLNQVDPGTNSRVHQQLVAQETPDLEEAIPPALRKLEDKLRQRRPGRLLPTKNNPPPRFTPTPATSRRQKLRRKALKPKKPIVRSTGDAVKSPRTPLGTNQPLNQPKHAPQDPPIQEPSEGDEIKIEKEDKCKPTPPNVRVSMNFNEAEVMDIIQWIANQTCKNFIISDAIRGGKLTIISKTPVTANEAYRAFLAALNTNNMTVLQVGRFLKVQMKQDALNDTTPIYMGKKPKIPNQDIMVTWLVPLKYLDSNSTSQIIKQLNTKHGNCIPYQPTNTLIISDTGTNMYRIMKVIEQLDTPIGFEEIRVIQVNYATATELVNIIQEIFSTKQGGVTGRTTPSSARKSTPSGRPSSQGDGKVEISKIISDERTNRIIVMAAPESFPKLMDLIQKLDVPVSEGEDIRVVYLQHADSEELANTLTSLAQGAGPGRSPGKRPGGQTKSATLFQGEVKVTADKATNSLVIVAGRQDFKSLKEVIGMLDIQRRQVFVEAVIMEISLDNSRETGLALHGGMAPEMGGDTIPILFGTQYGDLNSVTPNILNLLGFVGGMRGPNLEVDEDYLGVGILPKFGVILQLLQTSSNVNVLSTPHILTSDNEEAEIKVGENIPIPVGGGYSGMGNLASMLPGLASAAGGRGATGMNYPGMGGLGMMGMMGGMGGMGGINRQDVGLTLKITPQINDGDVIRMEIEEELSEVKSTGDPLGPTTTKRSAKTVVAIHNQQTVVIGGLMKDKIDISETKVPVLGDIPVIGWFFRSKRQTKTKTNMLLFLTPYIIDGPEDFRIIFKRKMAERREFLERFYSSGPDYKTFIDFRKKRGPLADIHITLSRELTMMENGGPGLSNEIMITPAVAPIQTSSDKITTNPGNTAGDTEGSPAPTGLPPVKTEESRLDVD